MLLKWPNVSSCHVPILGPEPEKRIMRLLRRGGSDETRMFLQGRKVPSVLVMFASKAVSADSFDSVIAVYLVIGPSPNTLCSHLHICASCPGPNPETVNGKVRRYSSI
jgi:hypothetical protein